MKKLLCVLCASVASSAIVVHAQQPREQGTEYRKVDHVEKLYYPAVAQSAHVQGAVVVKVSLDEAGRVKDVSLLSGPPVLASAAIANVKKWTFFPSAKREEIVVYAFTLNARVCGIKGKWPDDDLIELRQPNFVLLTSCPPPDRGSEDRKVDHYEKPYYPSIAKSARVQAAVVLKVSLDDQGRVTEASGLSAVPLLIGAAVDAVKKWTFVASAQREEVVVFAFTIDDRGCEKSPDRETVELIQPNLVMLTVCPAPVDI